MTLSERTPRSRPLSVARAEEEDRSARRLSSLDGLPSLETEPVSLYRRAGKRVFGLVLLALVLPVALVVSIPIALVNLALFRDPRRILFHQPRVGRDGEIFRIWKFRTMREAPEDTEGEDFSSWKSGRDRLRVTTFGRFLRNTHLDELPQLLNVLAGEMDFVGPRPEMVEIHTWASEAIPGFDARCAVRPGITGLAQITQGYAGMDAEAYAAKLEADLTYVQTMSFWTDFGIVLRTLVWMLEGKGWRRSAPATRNALEKTSEESSPRATMRPWPKPVSSRARNSSATGPARGIPNARID